MNKIQSLSSCGFQFNWGTEEQTVTIPCGKCYKELEQGARNSVAREEHCTGEGGEKAVAGWGGVQEGSLGEVASKQKNR